MMNSNTNLKLELNISESIFPNIKVVIIGYTIGSWWRPIPVNRKQNRNPQFLIRFNGVVVLRTAVFKNKQKSFKRNIAITKRPEKVLELNHVTYLHAQTNYTQPPKPSKKVCFLALISLQ